jgi:hypothetical protein
LELIDQDGAEFRLQVTANGGMVAHQVPSPCNQAVERDVSGTNEPLTAAAGKRDQKPDDRNQRLQPNLRHRLRRSDRALGFLIAVTRPGPGDGRDVAIQTGRSGTPAPIGDLPKVGRGLFQHAFQRVGLRLAVPQRLRGSSQSDKPVMDGRRYHPRFDQHGLQRNQLSHERTRQFVQILQRHDLQGGFPGGMVAAMRAQFLVQPERPFPAEVVVKLPPFVLLEGGIDAALDWTQPEQVGREAMDRSDLAGFQLPQRLHRQIVVRQLGQSAAQPKLDLIGGFVGKRQRDDLCNPQGIRPVQQEVQQAIDEERGLPGPGPRRDDDVAVIRRCRAVAGLPVRERPDHST